MKKIQVTIPTKEKQYTVYVGENILRQIPELLHVQNYSKVVIITDEYLEKTWLEKLTYSFTINPEIIVIKPGEEVKNIETVQALWKQMLKIGCDRKTLVINFGGGVIGDLGGFAASTFMRGLDFVQVPSTLLAAADASIGGKTGIGFANIKNLIGTFNQPIAIVIDTEVLKTLPEREFLSGFAEMIKQGLIQDKTYFEKITAKKPQDFSSKELVDIMITSCQLKANLVMEDELEQAQRKILNFGHTIGHAIEALSFETENPLRHGEAVNIGMIVETKISYLKGLLSEKEAQEIDRILHATGLPVTVPNINVNLIVNKIVKDKKNSHGQIKWVLLKAIGKAVYDQQVDEEIMIEALESIRQLR
ncbi:MAG TPA: 3-dehydroquinate synthase [Candidatus Saccharimonadales bacterium]|nr:3-dehydroquinate synthase [Candidatus Saccharimonadales bacterium]